MKKELLPKFSLAAKAFDNGKLNSARKMFVELSKKDPESPAIFAVLGDVCWEMQRLNEAVRAFKRAVKLAPKLEAASLGLFLCLLKLGKRAAAQKEMKRFMSISDSRSYREIVSEINAKCRSEGDTKTCNRFIAARRVEQVPETGHRCVPVNAPPQLVIDDRFRIVTVTFLGRCLTYCVSASL